MSAPAESFSDDDDDAPIVPSFVLSTFEDEEDVNLTVSTLIRPDIRRHASLALVYGLAIMTLDQEGAIERRVDELLADGPISEVDACNRIQLLLMEEANDHRI